MPNILLVCLDQLAAQVLPAWGGGASAPAIASLIERGVRFDQAHTTCPLCLPARASFWTGLLPHQTGVLHNGSHVDKMPDNAQVTPATPSIGSLLSGAGYRCVHAGKTHDGGALHGFDCLPQAFRSCLGPAWAPVNGDTFQDQVTVDQAETFLAEPGEGPWCLAVDIQNPHNICGWVGANADGAQTPLPPFPLPELPPNFTVADWDSRPDSVRYLCCAHRRQAQAGPWEESDWRRYLAAYHYYVDLGDAAVARVLAALQASGQAEDTVVICWSDHGDGIACHRQATKHTSFYQQTVHVPLVIAGPGMAAGRSIATPVSLLDLLPTVCAIAGIAEPAGLHGRSLWSAARGAAALEERPVLAQWYSEWGFTVEPGRMLRLGRFKYCAFREGYEDGRGEELYDLAADPWEQHNLAADTSRHGDLEAARVAFRASLAETSDPFLSLQADVDPRWRRHPSGYQHHRGPAAPTR